MPAGAMNRIGIPCAWASAAFGIAELTMSTLPAANAATLAAELLKIVIFASRPAAL